MRKVKKVMVKIILDDELSTLAGSTKGFADGSGNTTQFNTPYGLAVDVAGNVYVADYWNHKIRVINQNGELITLAGGDAGFEDVTCQKMFFGASAIHVGGKVK